MADVCLLLLCGVPASGKTSLTKTLIHWSKNKLSNAQGCCSSVPYQFIIIEYDRLLSADVEKHLILHNDGQEHNLSPWKCFRGDIVKCVDALMSALTSVENPTQLKTKLAAILRPPDVALDLWENFQCIVSGSLTDSNLDHSKACIVIDDNMYYQSMRYRYYQLARQYRTGFCQVYLSCDTNAAITQNAQRDVHVADEVIGAMASRIEVPDSARNLWEKHSLAVKTGQVEIQEVYSLIEQALKDPVEPVPEIDIESQNQSREICSASLLYQSDQILRKLVSQEMVSAKERNLSKPEMKTLASTLQSIRKQILDELKCGSIIVPADIVTMATNASKDADNELYDFLKRLFQVLYDGAK